MRKYLALLLLALAPLTAAAQDSTPAPAAPAVSAEETARDRDYLTALIEDKLSGAGRSIRLEGFAGALSSRATFDTLSIADENGTWITIKNGALAWNRAAILAGHIKIDELSAAEIDLPRLPGSAAQTPAPEAKPFALPDLPLSVDIGKIRADKLTLGAPVLGEAMSVSLSGAMSLAGGAGNANLRLERIDGNKGLITLTAGYANTSQQLSLDFLVDEGAGGFLATRLGLPGAPAMTLAVSGAGPISNYAAGIALSTDGTRRVSGEVSVTSGAALAKEGLASQIDAKLQGDISALFLPEYRDFFGPAARLSVTARRSTTGALALSDLTFTGAAVELTGAARLLPSGLPETADLGLKIATEGEGDILLPLNGAKTWVRSANLHLRYDQKTGDGWRIDGDIAALRRAEGTVGRVLLSGSGRIGQPDGTRPTLGGTLRLVAEDITLTDPALSEAIGPRITAKSTLFWQKGGPLNLPLLHLEARDMVLDGRVQLADLSKGLIATGEVTVAHSALRNLSRLAKRPLDGAIEGAVRGSATVLTGAFDLSAELVGTNLALNEPRLDNLLKGVSRLILSARRDENGLALRKITANATTFTAEAAGLLKTGENQLSATAKLADLSVMGGGLRGALEAKASLAETAAGQQIELSGTGAGLAIGTDALDRILAGQSQFSAKALRSDGRISLQALDLKTPQLTIKGAGKPGAGRTDLTLAAELANAALLAPGFPGPLRLSGIAVDENGRYRLDLAATGPGNSSAKIAGTLDQTFARADLTVTGKAEAALANSFIAPRSVQGPLSFDLRLAGAPGLDALSGKITTSGARLVAPALGLALENIDAQAALASGQLTLDARAGIEGGGALTLSGPISLAAPLRSDLVITLDRARLRDPELYDTRISGALQLAGTLPSNARLSGRLTLDKTEIRVPSASVGGTSAIPEVSHINEPTAARATRVRAGILKTESSNTGSNSAGLGLDLTIDAPNQIFVRGRGLDAELGGSLRLSGTTSNIVPIGEFSLIRGRLDILAKRFTLSEGQVALQGALVPWIMFKATTEQEDYVITLALEGPASEPALTITSAPELPEEEVLARLLFNHGLSNLSAFQAAQLASAVASLAGKGGDGIVSKLRQGFGLDDLDVGADETGATTLRVGKYLSQNLYTDVAIGSGGTTEINLNLDVTRNLTARGTVGSDGTSGLGIYFEKDY